MSSSTAADSTARLPALPSDVDETFLSDVLAGLRAAVDRFFEEVMVMADEPLVRANRLALLAALADQMNRVADLSRLST